MVYKKIILIIAFLLICPVAVFADSATRADFNGTWIGSVAVDGEANSTTPNLKIVITNNGVLQYFKNSSGEWYVTEPDDSRYSWIRNNLIYAWVNQGGVWSETQTFSLSFVNSNTLDVVQSRHVNNYSDNSDNETWNIIAKGSLTKDGSGNPNSDLNSGGGGGGGCNLGAGLGFAVLSLTGASFLRKRKA
jgi:hypothetical protein